MRNDVITVAVRDICKLNQISRREYTNRKVIKIKCREPHARIANMQVGPEIEF